MIELTEAQRGLLDCAAMRPAHGKSIWNAAESDAAVNLSILGLVIISANPKWIAPRVFATADGRVWVREHYLGDMPMGRQRVDKKKIQEDVNQVVSALKGEEDAETANRAAFCLMQALQRHFDEMPVEQAAKIREEFVGKDDEETFDEKCTFMMNELAHFSTILKDHPDIIHRIRWALDDAMWRAVHAMERR